MVHPSPRKRVKNDCVQSDCCESEPVEHGPLVAADEVVLPPLPPGGATVRVGWFPIACGPECRGYH